jgi:hypothetical protein
LRQCRESARLTKLVGLCCIPCEDIDEVDVYTKNVNYLVDRNEKDRREFLAATVAASGVSSHDASGAKTTISLGFPTLKKVCDSCWAKYNGVKLSTLTNMRKDIKHGKVNFARRERMSVPVKRRSAESNCFNWLQAYARTHGDHQSDYLETHLPDYRVKDVWRKYLNETHSKDSKHQFSDHVSEMNFRKMLDNDLPYIKIRKVKRFAKCDTCTDLRDAIDKCMGDRREKLKEELQEHIEWQFRERDKYYKHRFKARRFPSRYMTMSLDGMDNGKTAIPRRSREDKTSDANFRLGVHLTGVLMHGRKNPIHAYTWYDQFPTGSDSVVTIICHALRKTQEDGPLPPVLYLHLDNCGRENKNRFLHIR